MGDRPVRLVSAGTALPGPPIDTAALAARFGMNGVWEQWVETFIGTRTRYLAVDLASGKRLHSLADLAEGAARTALERAGLAPGDVDVVVLGTATPDELMPPTVGVVAERLGIDGVPVFQLQSGCSGAVQAIDVATSLLTTGRYRTALVVGGENIARHYDVHADLAAVPPAELVNFVLFGDGAGAAVLTTEDRPDAPVVRSVFTNLSGVDRPPGQTLRWFGLVDRDSAEAPASEDYASIAELVPVLADEVADHLLDELEWSRADVDYLLPPQLSAVMTGTITAELAFPRATEISCVADTGNNGNALLFFQLERLLATLDGPAKAIAIAIESSKWIKSGLALESTAPRR